MVKTDRQRLTAICFNLFNNVSNKVRGETRRKIFEIRNRERFFKNFEMTAAVAKLVDALL